MTRVLVVVLAALAFGGVGATPAHADDPLPPPIVPPGVTTPPDDGGNEVPPGPTYVITPGSEGTELGDPADPAQVEEAKQAAEKASGVPKKPGATKTSGVTVAGPEAPAQVPTGQRDLAAAQPLDSRWVIGSGALLLLVVVDLVRTAARRRTVLG